MYNKKQEISFICLKDIITIQKTIASWILYEERIEEKLSLARVVASLGLSITPLYNITYEKSMFSNERVENNTLSIYDIKTSVFSYQSNEIYNLKSLYISTMYFSIFKVKNKLSSVQKQDETLVYKKINNRLEEVVKNLNHILNYIEDTFIKDKLSFEYKTEIQSLRISSPARPLREDYCSDISPIDDAISEVLYSNFINLEIPTIECCASILNDFDFDWMMAPFISELSEQIEDEIYHAQILKNEYHKRGYNIASVKQHFRFWDMSRNEDLPTRLYIHQKMGEWIGIDAAMDIISKKKDKNISEIYTSIVCDELNHVKLGTHWIDKFSKNYSETKERALKKRSEFNETDNYSVKFPVNIKVCNMSGFKRDEINKLLYRQRKYGILSEEKDSQLKKVTLDGKYESSLIKQLKVK